MCSGHGSLTQPPGSIRVARRSNNSPQGAIYRIDTVDYYSYVRRVLPQEWGISWNAESLKAGSLAVKSYAWNRAVVQDGTFWNGQCYDVDDTVNYQVYRDSTAASTDSAIASAWRTWVRKNNQAFLATYRAGSPGMACGAENLNGTMMRQWGTKTCADQGKGYRDIVDDYYYPVSLFSTDIAPIGNELAFVAQQSLDFYGRPITGPEATWNIAALWNGQPGDEQMNNVLRSAEADHELLGVVRLYYTAFDRHPDGGARSWLNKPLTTVANGLINSPEGRERRLAHDVGGELRQGALRGCAESHAKRKRGELLGGPGQKQGAPRGDGRDLRERRAPHPATRAGPNAGRLPGDAAPARRHPGAQLLVRGDRPERGGKPLSGAHDPILGRVRTAIPVS